MYTFFMTITCDHRINTTIEWQSTLKTLVNAILEKIIKAYDDNLKSAMNFCDP